MMVCGPVPFTRMIAAARGPLDLLAPDGTFTEAATPTREPVHAVP
jgi:hypothetical protein